MEWHTGDTKEMLVDVPYTNGYKCWIRKGQAGSLRSAIFSFRVKATIALLGWFQSIYIEF